MKMVILLWIKEKPNLRNDFVSDYVCEVVFRLTVATFYRLDIFVNLSENTSELMEYLFYLSLASHYLTKDRPVWWLYESLSH